MAVVPKAARAAGPLIQRLMAAAPVAPAWVGLALALAYVATCVGYFAVFGEGELGAAFWREHGVPAIVVGLLVGYAPTAMAYSHRAALDLLEQLRPVLRCGPREFGALRREVASFDERALRAVGASVALVGSSHLILEPLLFGGALPDFRGPVFAWDVFSNLMPLWLGSRAVAHELRLARAFSRIGFELARVDLLDLRPLAPFGRRGLQVVLFVSLGLSIFALLLIGGWASDAAPVGWLLLLVLGVVGLLLPARGVHRRILAVKHDEIDRLRREIREGEAALMRRGTREAAEAAARLPALLALKREVESAREWPFDISTFVRFAFYVAIGLGSWLGGAVVERILGAALD